MHHDHDIDPPAHPYFIEHGHAGAHHDFLTQILHPDLLPGDADHPRQEGPFSFDLP